MNYRKSKKHSTQTERSKRTIQFHFMAAEDEAELIHERMASSGIVSLAAYLRKMSIDGYVINIDLSDVHELVSLLRYCTNNLNQYSKRAAEIGSPYAEGIEELCARQDQLWDAANEILRKLAKIK